MSLNSLSSYILPESPETPSPTDELQDEINTLPSSDTTSSADEESDADREWRESLQQLELLLSMIIVPFVGKYFGRKCAYWGEREIGIFAKIMAEGSSADTFLRMGEVYAVEVSCGDQDYKPPSISCSGRGRGCCHVIKLKDEELRLFATERADMGYAASVY